MLIAGKNDGRFQKNKVAEKFYLSIPTTFTTMTMAKNKYGGLCAPRHDAAIGPRGANFVW
jgi:hypothetical protein